MNCNLNSACQGTRPVGWPPAGIPAKAPFARGRRAGFSLLEMTIAVGILGVGLIMVATIFPVALFQHRTSVYHARSTELASKAEALLRSRVDPNTLWSDQGLLGQQLDSPWYVMPFANITTGGTWDAPGPAAAYSNSINVFPANANSLTLFGADRLTDKYSPQNDDEAQRAAGRLVWTAFYRRLANGNVHYSVAICNQQRGQFFAEQDVSLPDFAATPTANATVTRRFPVPWRVRVLRSAATGRLYCNGTGPEYLAELAPTGSKIMIQGAVYSTAAVTNVTVPAGRIYTVSDVFSPSTVEVRESVSDLPRDDLGYSFDVWVFPPPVVGGSPANVQFGQDSPLIDWRASL